MLRFDKEQLEKAIARTTGIRRAALCASCAERLIPFYERFWRQSHDAPSFYRQALDKVWKCLGREGNDPAEMETLFRLANERIPDEDELSAGSYAQDAAISVTYALDVCRTQRVTSAIRCLEQAYNVVDNYALNQLVPDGAVNLEAESAVLNHRLVQEELTRQRNELELCTRASDADWEGIVAQLRNEAERTRVLDVGDPGNTGKL
jgi:uncharacterized protein YjaG (DUF416 family)